MQSSILKIEPLDFLWQTQDPFLFCAHHLDFYPKGNANLGPDVSLEGRYLGEDFTIKDGFRMYHGKTVPGFPVHPHRGFETITIAKTGLVDHSDSLGSSGRFGNGDVQWTTAGKGVQHSEMFPLLNNDKENKFELFQIWLNLPRASKMVEAHYKMLWHEDIPRVKIEDKNGLSTFVNVIAGSFNNTKALEPTPDSWAANPTNNVNVWTIKMQAGAEIDLPKGKTEANRTLYFYKGGTLNIGNQEIKNYQQIVLNPDKEITLKNGTKDAYLLFLEGKPIKEPVAKYGPFVMNTQQEIQQTILDYQQTQFGGWPWPKPDQVHPKEKGRFANHANGQKEERI